METCWEHNQNMGCHKKLIPQTLKVLLMALRPGLEYLHNDSPKLLFSSRFYKTFRCGCLKMMTRALFIAEDHFASRTISRSYRCLRMSCGFSHFWFRLGSIFVSKAGRETSELEFETIKRGICNYGRLSLSFVNCKAERHLSLWRSAWKQFNHHETKKNLEAGFFSAIESSDDGWFVYEAESLASGRD